MGREAGKLVDLLHEGVDILFCCLLFSQGKILEVISREVTEREVKGLRREEVLNWGNSEGLMGSC